MRIDNSWERVLKESDPELWNLLTDENAESDAMFQSDTDEDIEGNDALLEKLKKIATVPHPTVLHDINGANVDHSEIFNIAPGEGHILVSFTAEADCEALAFVKEFPLGKGHFNESRDVMITPPQCIHTRLKCADGRFANNQQYVFAQLVLIERAAILNSFTFAENKRSQDDATAGNF